MDRLARRVDREPARHVGRRNVSGGEKVSIGENVSFAAKVLTVSDSVNSGDAPDRSGPAVGALLADAGIDVVAHAIVGDGVEPVADALRGLTEDFAGLVVTTGGTGFGPRDLTPEATLAVVERQAPGMAEAMRLATPKGRLSRAIAGSVGRCLVLNTPGSPQGAVECLAAVLDAVPHALELLRGERPHAHEKGSAASRHEESDR